MAKPPTGAPRWVKAFGIAAIVVALAVVVLHLTGNGFGGHVGLRGMHQP